MVFSFYRSDIKTLEIQDIEGLCLKLDMTLALTFELT